jgi:hypothetical protein
MHVPITPPAFTSSVLADTAATKPANSVVVPWRS